MLYERDYQAAMSVENQNRIKKYLAGSDTRKVVDVGLFTELKLTDKLYRALNKPVQCIHPVPSDMFYTVAKEMEFPGMKFLNEHRAHIVKNYWFPYLLDETLSMKYFTAAGSHVLNNRGRIGAKRTEKVLSIGAINPTGTSGHWIMTIDFFGVEHSEFMQHVHAWFAEYQDQSEQIFNLQLNIPHIDDIEGTKFYSELAQIKPTRLWFTSTFVNTFKLE